MYLVRLVLAICYGNSYGNSYTSMVHEEKTEREIIS